MAYIKTLQLNTGLSVSYWRLEQVSVDKKGGTVRALFRGYKDKTTRQSGLPASSKEFVIDISKINLTKDIYEEVYKAAKQAIQFGRIVREEGKIVAQEPFFADAVIDD